MKRRGRSLKVKSPPKRPRQNLTPRKSPPKFQITERAGPSGLQENKENEIPPGAQNRTPKRNRTLRPAIPERRLTPRCQVANLIYSRIK